MIDQSDFHIFVYYGCLRTVIFAMSPVIIFFFSAIFFEVLEHPITSCHVCKSFIFCHLKSSQAPFVSCRHLCHSLS